MSSGHNVYAAASGWFGAPRVELMSVPNMNFSFPLFTNCGTM